MKSIFVMMEGMYKKKFMLKIAFLIIYVLILLENRGADKKKKIEKELIHPLVYVPDFLVRSGSELSGWTAPILLAIFCWPSNVRLVLSSGRTSKQVDDGKWGGLTPPQRSCLQLRGKFLLNYVQGNYMFFCFWLKTE